MIKKGLQWLLAKRWWLIGLTILFTAGLQIAEIQLYSFSIIHALEIVLYLALILLVGVFLDQQLKSSIAQTRAIKILDIKHKLSLSLASANDWDALAVEIAKFPISVAKVQVTTLFLRDPISGKFEYAGHWQQSHESNSGFDLRLTWQNWVDQLDQTSLFFNKCQTTAAENQATFHFDYCLPIKFRDQLLGLLRFRLEPGIDLSPDEMDIFANVGDELAFALKTGGDRKTSTEMRTSETALAERRTVSHYLHDNLGQNLGYLCLKLDQLIEEKDQLSFAQIESDLAHMRAAANESYEIVRGTLETLQPETSPHLTNLLQEHARKVAERANFKVRFETRGRPIPFKDDIQSAIFYVCHEVLSNVEKHANASNVNILFDWSGPDFEICISDDGVGFNPQAINKDQHFGLEIVHERINNVNGRISVVTSINSGTLIKISVPLQSISQI